MGVLMRKLAKIEKVLRAIRSTDDSILIHWYRSDISFIKRATVQESKLIYN